MQIEYLIIGGSAAGITAANQILKTNLQSQVLCITAEPEAPYNKCWLVDWVAGEKAEDQLRLVIHSSLQLWTGVRVTKLDVQSQVAYCADGRQVSYQKVLLAMGVQPVCLPIPGIDLSHVFNFHTQQDAQKILNFVSNHQARSAVVVGAGLTGLEIADALQRAGLQVTVVDRADRPLMRQADLAGSSYLQGLMDRAGLRFCGQQQVAQIEPEQVRLASGEIIPADLVVMAVGVRPSALEIIGGELEQERGYARVNASLQTNLSNIWAAGDLILAPDLLTGQLVPTCSWPDAIQQGRLAAQSMLGQEVAYPGMLPIAVTHLFGQELVSCGDLTGENQLLEQVAGSYRKITVDLDGKIAGFLLIGDVELYPKLRRAILTNQRLDSV